MDKIDTELQAAATELLTSLRQGRGLDEHLAERLRKALQTATAAWAPANTISKSAANLFVDLAVGIEACSYAYGSVEFPGFSGQSVDVTMRQAGRNAPARS